MTSPPVLPQAVNHSTIAMHTAIQGQEESHEKTSHASKYGARNHIAWHHHAD
jgi:hypothetical protein